METYIHKVHYYETDKMGFVHHSNYIRWFEEARSDFFDKIGAPYTVTESMGIISPVLSVSCEYKSMMRFGQTCRIEVRITKLTPVRMSLEYRFYDADTNELCGTAASGHCFIGANGHPLSLKKHLPDVFELYHRLVWKPEET